MVGISFEICQKILTKELGMLCVAVIFVPRILTADQMQQHTDVCTEIHQLASEDETFLSKVITGEESWIYGYDLETEQQLFQWKSPASPRPKNVR